MQARMTVRGVMALSLGQGAYRRNDTVANRPYGGRSMIRTIAIAGLEAPSKTPSHRVVRGRFIREPGRNRTYNPRIKSPLLCQLSYEPVGVTEDTRSPAKAKGFPQPMR